MSDVCKVPRIQHFRTGKLRESGLLASSRQRHANGFLPVRESGAGGPGLHVGISVKKIGEIGP
jgi:hypothetical protein